jgi:hypothetical protein
MDCQKLTMFVFCKYSTIFSSMFGDNGLKRMPKAHRDLVLQVADVLQYRDELAQFVGVGQRSSSSFCAQICFLNVSMCCCARIFPMSRNMALASFVNDQHTPASTWVIACRLAHCRTLGRVHLQGYVSFPVVFVFVCFFFFFVLFCFVFCCSCCPRELEHKEANILIDVRYFFRILIRFRFRIRSGNLSVPTSGARSAASMAASIAIFWHRRWLFRASSWRTHSSIRFAI